MFLFNQLAFLLFIVLTLVNCAIPFLFESGFVMLVQIVELGNHFIAQLTGLFMFIGFVSLLDAIAAPCAREVCSYLWCLQLHPDKVIV